METNYPKHLGFIVDGNRRWARERKLPTLEGHRRGLDKVELVCDELAKTPVEFATFYLFSTENWNRSEDEVSYLMDLATTNIVRLARKMRKNNIRCLILGNENRLSPTLLEKLRESEEITKDCTGLTVCLCFNYGGQQEIVDAARKLSESGQDFTIENFSECLYYPEVPPVDMIVRTSGEQRISGFMLWRAAYSEFHFIPKFWPDIEPSDIKDILGEFQSRSRRFGK